MSLRASIPRVHDYLAVLVEGLSSRVDLWLGETLSLIAEGETVRTAGAETGKPFWISFTLPGAELDKPRLRSGETVVEAARWAAGSGASALLFNCSRPEVMGRAVEVASAVLCDIGSTVEIGVYANAFEASEEDGAANATLHDVRSDLTTDAYTRFACGWVDAGATLIGGCCGIGASHIHGLARTLKATATALHVEPIVQQGWFGTSPSPAPPKDELPQAR